MTTANKKAPQSSQRSDELFRCLVDPILVVTQKAVRELDADIDKKVAALFAKFDITPSVNSWTDSVNALAAKLLREEDSWISPTIRQFAPWLFVVGIARRDYLGFRSAGVLNSSKPGTKPIGHQGYTNQLIEAMQAGRHEAGCDAERLARALSNRGTSELVMLTELDFSEAELLEAGRDKGKCVIAGCLNLNLSKAQCIKLLDGRDGIGHRNTLLSCLRLPEEIEKSIESSRELAQQYPGFTAAELRLHCAPGPEPEPQLTQLTPELCRMGVDLLGPARWDALKEGDQLTWLRSLLCQLRPLHARLVRFDQLVPRECNLEKLIDNRQARLAKSRKQDDPVKVRADANQLAAQNIEYECAPDKWIERSLLNIQNDDKRKQAIGGYWNKILSELKS